MAERRIRLLFAGTTFVVGGAERVLSHLVRGLARPPFDVHLLALREPGAIGEELRAAGIPVTSRLTGEGKVDLGLLPRLRAFLLRERFDAIYFLDHAHAVFYLTLASLGTGVRARVMPVHTTRQWGGAKSLKRPIRLVLPKLDRVIAIAEAQRRYLIEEEGVPPERLEVIPNGIPLRDRAEDRSALRAAVRAELGTAPDAPVVGITAVLRPEKNHELLLAAFARLRATEPAAELWLIGDGPRRAALEAEAVRLGLGLSARFLGSRSDARRLMAGLDLACLSSHPAVETLPLSLLEAMDADLPVVATRVGALDEMVEEGRSGILVEAGDVEGYAEALCRLISDAKLRHRMGRRGAEIVAERFSVDRMCERTEELLMAILRPKR